MAEVWDYMPEPEISEALEWKTELVRADGYTQRIALRKYPRLIIRHKYVMDISDATGAAGLAATDEDVIIPLWQDLARVGPLTSGTTTIPVDTTGMRIADELIIRDYDGSYELKAVSVVDAASITLAAPLANDYTQAIVVGTVTGRASVKHTTQAAGNILLDATLYAVDKTLSPGGASHLDGDIPFPDGTVMSSVHPIAPISGTTTLDYYELDSIGGKIYRNRAYDYAAARSEMTFDNLDRAELAEMRGFIYSRMGKQKMFWYPWWDHQFQYIRMDSASDMVVKNAGYARSIGSGPIAVLTEQLGWYAMECTGSNELSDTEEVLTLSRAQLNWTFLFVGVMRMTRFNADRIEIKYHHGGRTTCKIPVIEDMPHLWRL